MLKNTLPLNIISILIFFNVKNIWLKILLFLFNFFSFFEAIQLIFLKKIGYILNLPFNFSVLIEMPSLNRNERVACLECGREYTHKDASRHRRTCGNLKCSNCNFYTYNSKELANHFKKKHSQHNIKLCAQQSPNILQEKVNFFFFKLRNYYDY